MINDYKKEFKYAQVLERFAFDVKWLQKIRSKEQPLPVDQYWHLDFYPSWQIYDKETDTPVSYMNRNSIVLWGNDWMDKEWKVAFGINTPF